MKLCADRSSEDEQRLRDHFWGGGGREREGKKANKETKIRNGGRLKVKIRILFHGDNS
jgi:hypothetical protein